ncbi:MAG: hypothetical protein ACO1RT_17310 [Planctomycetaceae bacterium]
MLLNRGHLGLHLGFAVPSLVIAVAGVGWWIWESVDAGRIVGGGSASGLACGIAAALVIVFEMLLWPRKIFRKLRLIPAKYWMAAHIWLGIASLPLAIAHCGLHLGGWLPASLMVLFVLTIVSGLYGLAVQNILPRWMLWNLPAETIYNQIDYVAKVTIEDARRALLASCGRHPDGETRSAADPVPELIPASSEPIVIGAIRGAGKTSGRAVVTTKFRDVTPDAEPLWTAFDEIQPYLLEGKQASTPVTHPARARQYFQTLRGACGADSLPVIGMLESFCEQRRQFDVQQTCHRWLHAWLPVHIAFSVAVTVLLAVHVYTALKYW